MESKLKTLSLFKDEDVSSNVYIVEKGEYYCFYKHYIITLIKH